MTIFELFTICLKGKLVDDVKDNVIKVNSVLCIDLNEPLLPENNTEKKEEDF
jgi:hypothetical protein